MSSSVEQITLAASATSGLLQKFSEKLPQVSNDVEDGLSLLLLRPHVLINTLQSLTILLASRLCGFEVTGDLPSISLEGYSLDEPPLPLLHNDLIASAEMLEKIKGMENKLEYQIKKLVGLADAVTQRGQAVIETASEDPLSFKPNLAAISSTVNASNDETSGGSRVYRPPRVAAVPYNEPNVKRQRQRNAPALLSEFAAGLDNAPLTETTSGLSTRPVASGLTNSVSAKRAAELKRMNDFEEENMTRLVATKREAKRRREDELSLSMGYGVGAGRGRGRRQNGLEAELEGVLGDRRSKGVWDGLRKGKSDGVLERGKKRAKRD